MASAVVGILRAMLTADTAQYETSMRKAGETTDAVGKKISQQAERMAKAFGGDKLLASANSLAQAVAKIGGASKLTEGEQARVNRTVTEAISKYTALGKSAPAAIVDLEKATRKTDDATKGFGTTVAGMGKTMLATAAGFFTAQAAFSALRSVVRSLIDEFKTLTIGGAAVDDVSGNFERLTAQAGRSGATLLGVLKAGTHNTISDFDLMKTVNEDLTAGLKITDAQFRTLATGAFALAQRNGTDVKEGLDAINEALLTGRTRSVAAITGRINQTKAEEDFARSLGVSKDQLSEEGKLQATRLAIIKGVGAATERLGEQTDGLDERVAQAQTFWKNFQNELGRTIATSPVINAALTSIHDTLQKAFGADQKDIVKGLAAQIDQLAIGVVAFAKAGVQSAGFVIKEFIALYKVIGNVNQILDLTILGFHGLALGFAKAVNVATFGKAFKDEVVRIRTEMDLLAHDITERGKKLKAADVLQAGVDTQADQITAALEAMRVAMAKAAGASGLTAAGLAAVGKGGKSAADGVDDASESFIKANTDSEDFRKKLDALNRDLVRGRNILNDAEFAKEFQTRVEDIVREIEKFGLTGTQVPEAVQEAFRRLSLIDLKKFADEFHRIHVRINQERAKEEQATADRASAVTLGLLAQRVGIERDTANASREIEFQRAEFGIAMATKSGASWQKVYAMERQLSAARLRAALHDLDVEFSDRTKTLNRDIPFEDQQYQLLETNHNEHVRQMVEAWQLGENEKIAALKRTNLLAFQVWDALKGNLQQLQQNLTSGFANLFFGAGNDPDGSLKKAADDATQRYQRLKESGTASAEAITEAFMKMKDAQDEATSSFADRFKQKWLSIKSFLFQLFDDILSTFVNHFIAGMVRGITGSRLGEKLGSALIGGGGGGGLGGGATAAGTALVSGLMGGSASAASPALMAALEGGTATTAAGGAAGGGIGGLGAFFTNPWTIGIGAGIGGYLLYRHFFGGPNDEEKRALSDARGKFYAQFGGSGKLVNLVQSKTGEVNGGGLIWNLARADRLNKFRGAEDAIATALAPMRVRKFNLGGFVPPGVVQPAILHGGSMGEIVAPVDKLAKMQGGRNVIINHNVTINGMIDRDGAESFFRDVIIPAQKRALTLNTDDLLTVTSRVVRQP